MSISENFNAVRNRASEAAMRVHRNPSDITVLSVSKTFPAEYVQEAVDSGIRLFGENRVQEAKEKIPALTGDFAFHMIGHLQSNKAKDAVSLFDVIHSIDSLSTLEKVDQEAFRLGKVQKILIQINSSGEETKSGTDFQNASELAGRALDLKNISLLGFMTIGPLNGTPESIRTSFRRTRETLEKTNLKYGISLKELSMGMSGDFETAVEEGATIIRVGSLIFGGRNYGH